jgi:hypothetical protein
MSDICPMPTSVFAQHLLCLVFSFLVPRSSLLYLSKPISHQRDPGSPPKSGSNASHFILHASHFMLMLIFIITLTLLLLHPDSSIVGAGKPCLALRLLFTIVLKPMGLCTNHSFPPLALGHPYNLQPTGTVHRSFIR